MEMLKALVGLLGIPGGILAAAVVLLWRERERALNREIARLDAQLKAAEAESAQLRGMLMDSQKQQTVDAEKFLTALAQLRGKS